MALDVIDTETKAPMSAEVFAALGANVPVKVQRRVFGPGVKSSVPSETRWLSYLCRFISILFSVVLALGAFKSRQKDFVECFRCVQVLGTIFLTLPEYISG